MSNIPGASDLLAGDLTAGFYGEVDSSDFINAIDLSNLVNLKSGSVQNNDIEWLKFSFYGSIYLMPKKSIRYDLSWRDLNELDLVYGNKEIEVNGVNCIIRLMKGANKDPANDYRNEVNHHSEWNRLLLPLHENSIDKGWEFPNNVEDDVSIWEHDFGSGRNGMYTDDDLGVSGGTDSNGTRNWCQEVAESSNYRITRGGPGVTRSGSSTHESANLFLGWRPVLVFSKELDEDAPLLDAVTGINESIRVIEDKKQLITKSILEVDKDVDVPTDATLQELADAIGKIKTGAIEEIVPGDGTTLYGPGANRRIPSKEFIKINEVQAHITGVYRISHENYSSSDKTTITSRIYIDEEPVGLLRITSNQSLTYTEDFAVKSGQNIQLYARVDSTVAGSTRTSGRLTIKADIPDFFTEMEA